MVTESQRQLAFDIVDATIAHNAKVFLLLLIFFYLCFMLWYSYRVMPSGTQPHEIPLSQVIMGASFRFGSGVLVLLYPLVCVMFLFRGFTLSAMANFLWAFYGIVFVIVTMFVFVYGYEKLLDLFGLSFISRRRRSTRRTTRR